MLELVAKSEFFIQSLIKIGEVQDVDNVPEDETVHYNLYSSGKDLNVLVQLYNFEYQKDVIPYIQCYIYIFLQRYSDIKKNSVSLR